MDLTVGLPIVLEVVATRKRHLTHLDGGGGVECAYRGFSLLFQE